MPETCAASNRERVLVFGASGFLGSHVADVLSEQGHYVRLFDIVPSPYRRPDQEMVVGDMRDRAAVAAAAEGASIVYNFAGIADIGDAREDPARTAEINVLGTINSLDAAVRARTKRYVFASTVYVYSNHGSFYRASKQAAEAFIETYQQDYGLDFTILRYGTLYGRRADRRNRVYQLLREALTTGAIRYPGNGDARREFIHVRDAAALSVCILADEYANRHLVLTGQESTRIADLLSMIQEMLPGNIPITFSHSEPSGHYQMTAYNFTPRLGHKLVPDDYVDLGQGLLDCMSELCENVEPVVERVSVRPVVVMSEGEGQRDPSLV